MPFIFGYFVNSFPKCFSSFSSCSCDSILRRVNPIIVIIKSCLGKTKWASQEQCQNKQDMPG